VGKISVVVKKTKLKSLEIILHHLKWQVYFLTFSTENSRTEKSDYENFTIIEPKVNK